MCSDPEIISKDFLEKALGKKVKSFTIKTQADTGDNFMSILNTLDVHLESHSNKEDGEQQEEPLYLLTKCYPMHPSRQEFLNHQNYFWKELCVYKLWLPELIKFQQEKGLKEIIKPDFPTFVAGDAINFDLLKGELENSNAGKVYKPWDNYVMMVDLKKTGGFQMLDRHVGLDRDHGVLIMDAQAKIHALSWAYKKAKNIEEIKTEFPFLEFDVSRESVRKMFENTVDSNLDIAIEAVKSTFGANSTLIPAIKDFKSVANTIMWIIYSYGDKTDKDLADCLKLKPAAAATRNRNKEIPWRVVLHSDSHSNNMLFRYDPQTNKPEKVILLDLQVCREMCPTLDLVYLMYTSGDTEFRKNHMDELLNIYFEKFNHYCQLLKCETLPGFTLEELKYRFHRMKSFGLMMCLIAGGVLLKDKEEAVQLDSLEGMSQEEICLSLSKGMDKNVRYNKRITETLQELQSEGII